MSSPLRRILLAACLAIFSSSVMAADRPKVITTFTIIADIAKNVAGEAADVQSITKAGAEIHNYQPTPGDILKAQDADLVLWNGLNLELWFQKFLVNLKDVPNIEVSAGVTPIGISQGPYKDKPNPHAWMSPSNALIYVENIRKALSDIDPDGVATYTANAKTYSDKIRALDADIRRQIEAIPAEKRWLVTSEGAFSYLARDFGLEELYLWPINSDSQGTPSQVRAVIDAMRKHNIHVIFSESTVSANPAKQVASETGAAYGGVLYVDSLSNADGSVPTYLDLLRVTAETITKGLAQ